MKRTKHRALGNRLDGNESGFTLIELLVVIVIIAILAAIAIPVFFAQREKGYRAQITSSLRDAATTMQAWSTEQGGDYTLPTGVGPDSLSEMAWLEDNGWKQSEAVSVDVVVASQAAYCLQADHSALSEVFNFSSVSGQVAEGAC